MTDFKTISTRLSDEDTRFLHAAKINGARTPSEKLRKMVTQARQRAQGVDNHSEARDLVAQMIEPTLRMIQKHEVETGTHSEALQYAMSTLPEALAYLIGTQGTKPDDIESMRQIEADTVERIVRLCAQIVRLAITRQAPCYDPSVVRNQLAALREVWTIAEEHIPVTEGEKQL